MNVLLILLGIGLAAFIILQIFLRSTQKNIETYPYEVVETYKDFEIRNYEASLFTAVKLETNEYGKGSSQGFSVLAKYIFGGNETNEKIAMTSPVAISLEDSMTVMFMVPKKFNKATLPEPNNKNQIGFREEPAKKVAAITFGGWANDEKIKDYQKKLTAALDANDIKYTDRFYFLGYNAPSEIFNRKNEVIVELEEKI